MIFGAKIQIFLKEFHFDFWLENSNISKRIFYFDFWRKNSKISKRIFHFDFLRENSNILKKKIFPSFYSIISKITLIFTVILVHNFIKKKYFSFFRMSSLIPCEMYDTANEMVKISLEIKSWTYCYQVSNHVVIMYIVYHYCCLRPRFCLT